MKRNQFVESMHIEWLCSFKWNLVICHAFISQGQRKANSSFTQLRFFVLISLISVSQTENSSSHQNHWGKNKRSDKKIRKQCDTVIIFCRIFFCLHWVWEFRIAIHKITQHTHQHSCTRNRLFLSLKHTHTHTYTNTTLVVLEQDLSSPIRLLFLFFFKARIKLGIFESFFLFCVK